MDKKIDITEQRKPKMGEEYYSVDRHTDEVIKTKFVGSETDKYNMIVGNYYNSYDVAFIFAVEQREIYNSITVDEDGNYHSDYEM